MYLSSNGTSYDIADNLDMGAWNTLPRDTPVWLKVGWTGTQYYVSTSTDGTSYTTATLDSTVAADLEGDQFIGNDPKQKTGIRVWPGNVYIDENTYFKQNNAKVWDGIPITYTLQMPVLSANEPSYAIKHYLQDIYLSNDLTYIVAEPEPVTPQLPDASADNMTNPDYIFSGRSTNGGVNIVPLNYKLQSNEFWGTSTPSIGDNVLWYENVTFKPNKKYLIEFSNIPLDIDLITVSGRNYVINRTPILDETGEPTGNYYVNIPDTGTVSSVFSTSKDEFQYSIRNSTADILVIAK